VAAKIKKQIKRAIQNLFEKIVPQFIPDEKNIQKFLLLLANI
jgi:hypothetical protein